MKVQARFDKGLNLDMSLMEKHGVSKKAKMPEALLIMFPFILSAKLEGYTAGEILA